VPSPAPSPTPGRRLLADLIDSRYLQEDNVSDDNVTTDAPEMEEDVEEVCECPPEVITTFTSTLTFADPTELESVDFAALRAAIITSGDYPDNSAVATATIKVSMSYTFEGDTAVTSDECQSAVASAYGVAATTVMCTEGTAATTTTENVTTTTAAATTTTVARRLLDSHATAAMVMDVEISFAEEDAQSAVYASTPLDLEITGQTITTPLVAVVTVEVVLEVTSDDEVAAPSAADITTALADFEFESLTVAVSEPEVSYTRMPCSASDDTVCGSGYDLRSGSLGCAGAACTAADDRETCCTQVATAGAQGTCMLGSLTVLALSCNFAF
jgi:hypothetical protein